MAGLDAVFLGYSVIEDRRSLQAPLQRWAAREGHQLAFIGFGGLNLQYMPHMLDILAGQMELAGRILVLDVCSSREREWFGRRRVRYDALLGEIAHRLAALRCRPVFLYLYRTDVDPAADPFRAYLDDFAAAQGIPCIDLAAAVHGFIAQGGSAGALIRDEVHTTPEGADFYAEALLRQLPLLQGARPIAPPPPNAPSPAYRTLPLANLAAHAAVPLATRHGLTLPFIELRGGERLAVTLDRPGYVAALLVLASPEAGRMAVERDGTADAKPCEGYDVFAYYPHLAAAPFGRSVARQLVLEALEAVPEPGILTKGDWTPGTRINRISHLMIQPEPAKPSRPLPATPKPAAPSETVSDLPSDIPPWLCLGRSVPGDGATVQALLDSCEILGGPQLAGQDGALLRRIQRAMNSGVLERLGLDVLSAPELSWTPPLGEVPVPLLGALPHLLGSYLFFGGAEPCSVIVFGRSVIGTYDHRRHRLLTPAAPDPQVALHLKSFFQLLRHRDGRLARYAARMTQAPLRRALVLGDQRPAHYLSQGLNYHAAAVQPSIAEFRAQGGLLVVVRDWCFIDPRRIFPELAALPGLEVSSSELQPLAMDLGLLCQRFIRYGARTDFSTLRRVTPRGIAASGQFGVWICLDGERLRFRNQVAVLARVLERLQQVADAAGQQLVVYWDGWTMGSGALRSARDDTVIGQIRGLAAAVRAESRAEYVAEELFELDLAGKLARAGGARIAYSTYGTASLAPSVISGIPTVAYHVRKIVQEGGYADPDSAWLISEPELQVVGRFELTEHLREFEITPEAMLAATEALLAKPAAGPA